MLPSVRIAHQFQQKRYHRHPFPALIQLAWQRFVPQVGNIALGRSLKVHSLNLLPPFPLPTFEIRRLLQRLRPA